MKRFFVLPLLVFLLMTSSAFAAKRIALVIGNGAYKSGALRNPANDATDIAEKLRKLDFDVTLLTDADQRTMERQIREFRNSIYGADIRLFYYAGHGLQVKGVNYLLPVNIDIRYEDDVKYEAVDAGRVLDSMAAAGTGANIVILDACRNNPFKRSFRSASQGLARMPELDGSIIVYATAPGDVASDGSGRNGLFTQHFLKYLGRPGLTLDQVFKRTGRDVARATNNSQRPWLSVGLYDDIYLAGGNNGQPTQVALAPIPQKAPAPVKQDPSSPSRQSGTWSDPTTGMEFVWVPGGCFQMGSNDGADDEKPIHEVCVDGFWMAKYEVTRGQFRQFVNDTSYKTDAERKGKAWAYDSSTNWNWKEMPGYTWKNVGYTQNDSHPVTVVSWNDATAFIKWLKKRSDKAFALPTEAEWEYAARAGSTTKWFWGNDPDSACQYCNGADQTETPDGKRKWTKRFECSDGYWNTSPVGTYKPNKFGIYDMAGNVWEWCTDIFHNKAYSNLPRNNPVGTSGSSYRVLRGGSWTNKPSYLRTARRVRDASDKSTTGMGFRLVIK